MKIFKVKSNNKTYNVKANDAEHAAKLVKLLQKDARRLDYDDDIIKVTLNGKEVYKGIAENWVDDDFYKNFKWTGSQYEASNAKGKWVVKVMDSTKRTKDEAPSREVLQQLLDDETAAIGAYNIAIKNEDGKLDDKAIAVLRAIRDDEIRHRENLNAIMAGNVTEKNLEDSVKDALIARLYKSPFGKSEYRRVQLLLDGKEVASLTQNEARALAAKISELANSATNAAATIDAYDIMTVNTLEDSVKDEKIKAGAEFVSKNGHRIKIVSVDSVEFSPFDGSVVVRFTYDYEMANGKNGRSAGNNFDLQKMLKA